MSYPDFIGTLSLKNTEDKQLAYASQLYGTYFNVYCQIELSTDKAKLEAIRLYLINYKGHFDLGLLKDENDNQTVTFDESTGELELNVFVKALSNRNGPEKFVRVPCGSIALDSLKFLTIERQLIPMHSDADGDPIHLRSGVFDSEFFSRDGMGLVRIRQKEEMEVRIKSPGRRCETGRNRLI